MDTRSRPTPAESKGANQPRPDGAGGTSIAVVEGWKNTNSVAVAAGHLTQHGKALPNADANNASTPKPRSLNRRQTHTKKGSEVDVAKPDDEQWEGEGFPGPFDNGLGYLRVYLVSARHQLLGASHLLTCKAFLGEDTLARASIEASASAYHLAKNWADPAKFVKAAAVHRIWSLEERRKLFDGETRPEVVAERTRTVERAEAALKYGVTHNFWDEGVDVKTIGRQRNATDMCKSLFKNTAAMSDDR